MEEQAVVPDAADDLSRRPAWMVGGGEMGRLLRSIDWSRTPLGPMDDWPSSLRTTVSLVLQSNFPIALTWGPSHTQIYNDGYWPLCGDKHPSAMGSDFRECWASAWPAIGETYASALAGQPAYLEDQRMFVDRNGYLEEAFFTFSFSPIYDDAGQVAGLFHPTTETTARILGQRRTRSLRDLMTHATEARSVDETLHLVAQTLADAELDLPFVLIYRLDATQDTARLIAQAGLPAGTRASPAHINLLETSGTAAHSWPLRQAAATRHPVLVADLLQRFGDLYCGPYPEALSSALVLPLRLPGEERAAAVMVAGISSRLPLNEAYRAYNDLLAAGVSTAMAHAYAYETEHLRAESLADVARSKADFLARMSHEIRTPMNAVIGMTTLLQGTRLDGEQHDYVETIRTGGDHLLTIINDILDLSKIEAGKLELDRRPFDLRECLEGALDLVSVRAAQKGLELLLLIEDDVPHHVLGDAARLRQVLINLADNAVKFTRSGEVTIRVRTEGRVGADGEQALSLVVRDTGVGITPEQMGRLFKAFAQADSSITRLYGGTGLGLAISKRLAQLMGGDIAVDSRSGEGTTFTVHMRLNVAATVEPPPPQDLAGRRMLVVDDNATNCLILDRFLHGWKVQAEVCASGEQALKLLESGQRFDLAMLDHHMPDMDGAQLARAIRQLPDAAARMPLVLLSSVTERDSGGDFNASLPKPVKPAQLFDTLQHALTATQRAAAAPANPDSGMGRSRPLRLLVAEDNAVNSRVIGLLLQKLGYDADIVPDGLQVLEALERQPYDAVLMDLLMPDMDGLAATRAIAQRLPNKRQRPYVIGLSAHAMEDARQSCLDAGMDDYLAKPVLFEQLKETLQRCWERRQGVEPAVVPQRAVDEGVLLELSALIGEKEVRELIDIYLVSTPRLLTDAVLAARRRDAAAVGRVFHEIKSTSAALGALQIRHLCEKLEAERRQGNVYGLERHVAAVHHAFDLARTDLQDFGLHGLPGLPGAASSRPPATH